MGLPNFEPEQQFTQLIRRTARTKVTVLLLLLVALFIVWTTRTSGTQKAEIVDKEFCRHIITDHYYFPLSIFGNDTCDASPLTLISMARHHHDNDPPRSNTQTSEEFLKESRDFLSHLQEMLDYDWNRRQAYRIEFALPYAKSSVSLNGALISAIWPFAALLTLSVAIAFSLRQTCYEIHLAYLLTKTKSDKNHGMSVALTEHASGDISDTEFRGRPIHLYGKPFGIYPETTFSIVLFVAVSVIFLNLVTDFGPQITVSGDDIFSQTYYIWIYLFAVFMAIQIWRTRRLWRRSLEETVGEVRSSRLFVFHKFATTLVEKTIIGIPAYFVLISICAAAGLSSLFLHWGGEGRGISLFIRSFDSTDGTWVVQLTMLIAVLFLVHSIVFSVSKRIFRLRDNKVFRRIRMVGAWFVLIVSGFILFYAVVGLYGELKDHFVLPRIGAYSQAASSNLQNLPTLDESDFSLGFTVFTFSCGIVACLELLRPSKSRNQHI